MHLPHNKTAKAFHSFFKLDFHTLLIVLSFCYCDFYLSLHDVVTCSSKPNLTGYLAVFSHVCIIFIFFLHTLYAYFEVRHPQLDFK